MSDFLADVILKDAHAITAKVDLREVKGKTILITGASGLIGHYLVAALKTGTAGNPPREIFLTAKGGLPPYFKTLTEDLPVKFLRGDLTNEDFLKALPAADYIIHGAGYGQPGKFMKDPVKTLALNTLATFALFKKLNRGGKFLFLSSSEVYTGLTGSPHKESEIGTTNTDHPRACYIEGKRTGEAIVNAYRAEGVLAKSARICLAYGPGTRVDDARVLNSFIQKALAEKEIRLLDQGAAHRTYLYVTDAVELLFHILFSGTQGIYNVGGDSRTTIADLAQMVGEYLNIPVYTPADSSRAIQGAPDDVRLDMARIVREFKKTSFVPLSEGLKRTIAWQKELYR